MESLKECIVKALDDLEEDDFRRFKWLLRQPENVAGFQPLTKRALQNAGVEDVVDQIVQSFPDKESVIMVTVLPKIDRCDLVWMFGNTPPVVAPHSAASPGEAPHTIRDAFLKHSSPLSLDRNTACSKYLILSKDNRKVTYTDQDQGYPEHPERFASRPNVLSRESLPGRSYFEVEWSGRSVVVAVSYKDIDRKEMDRSVFGNDKSWRLGCRGSDDDRNYQFKHNDIDTAVLGPGSSTESKSLGVSINRKTGVITVSMADEGPCTGRYRWGVFVDHAKGVLSFYSVDVDRSTMSLLHSERTTFTQPLYAGIAVCRATAEVCKIW